jgi:hypothetical protein
LIPVLFCAVTWVLVRSLDYVEFGVARKFFLGGAVRRLLGAHIYLQNLESSLLTAATPNDCWIAIRDACRHLGFQNVRIRLLGELYQAQFGSVEAAPGWSMRIPLSENDYVNCSRQTGCGVAALGIAAFADLLANTLRAKLPSLRPSTSIDPQIAALVAHIENSEEAGALTSSASL